MLEEAGRFDWDEHNVLHVGRHRVTPAEVEEAFLGPNIMQPVPAKREQRYRLFGVTDLGRYLVVVFTIRQKRIRPITAYDMNRATRRRYAAQISKATRIQE